MSAAAEDSGSSLYSYEQIYEVELLIDFNLILKINVDNQLELFAIVYIVQLNAHYSIHIFTWPTKLEREILFPFQG